MKETFKKKQFQGESLECIQTCNKVISEYQEQGLRLTLRQLYYQFVAHNLFPDTRKYSLDKNGKWVYDPKGTKNAGPNYKWLGGILNNGRLTGDIDWGAIEDRGRQPRRPGEYENLKQLIDAAIYSYRLPRWEGQRYYAELWVEKEALAGVLEPLAREFHVTLMVNKGYSSQSAMYESAGRFSNQPRKPILFYLGDHDPSGEDMVRDIKDRLIMFGIEDIQVEKIALTMDQIKQYNPPPNPAKMKDTRAKKYVEKYGDSSWEVDALPPEILGVLIRDAFESIIDKEEMEKILEREESDKKRLRNIVKGQR